MHKILIRPGARNDIKKIWRYSYKNWGEEQADTYTFSLGQTINENPEIGSSIEHVR
jgi:toxin ParE1/3/4